MTSASLFRHLFSIIMVSSVLAPAQSEERQYQVLLGPEASKALGNSGIGQEARIDWNKDRASILLSIDGDSIPQRSIFKGDLDNSTPGNLSGQLYTIEGEKSGVLTLKRGEDQKEISWNGTISNRNNKMEIELRRFKSDDGIDEVDQTPLNVTNEFLSRSDIYIPRDLYLYARPKFYKFGEAIAMLDTRFPKWRSGIENRPLNGDILVDYETADVSEISNTVRSLRASKLFEYVELGVAEYGGVPEQVSFSKAKYPYKSTKEFIAVFRNLSDKIATEFFCKRVCEPIPMSTKGRNVRVFEISGRSEDLHFNRRRHWEKYVVAMTAYTDEFIGDDSDSEYSGFNIQFNIVSGYLAASGAGSAPPDARFKEHPIDQDELSSLSSKLQQSIAKKFGTYYQENSDDSN